MVPVTVMPAARSREAKNVPAASAGSASRPLDVAEVRPLSTESAETGETTPVATYDAGQPSAVRGPVNSVSSIVTLTDVRPWARSAAAVAVASAAMLAGRAAWPAVRAPAFAGRRVSVASPPPTRTTCPGVAPVTTRVASRALSPRVCRTVTAVSSLRLLAGCCGRASPRDTRAAPLATSSTLTVTSVPSALEVSAFARAAASSGSAPGAAEAVVATSVAGSTTSGTPGGAGTSALAGRGAADAEPAARADSASPAAARTAVAERRRVPRAIRAALPSVVVPRDPDHPRGPVRTTGVRV